MPDPSRNTEGAHSLEGGPDDITGSFSQRRFPTSHARKFTKEDNVMWCVPVVETERTV